MDYLESERVSPQGYRQIWEKTVKDMRKLSDKARRKLRSFNTGRTEV